MTPWPISTRRTRTAKDSDVGRDSEPNRLHIPSWSRQGFGGRRAFNASPSSIAMMDAEPVNPYRGSSSGRMIAAFKGQMERTVSKLVSPPSTLGPVEEVGFPWTAK